MVPKELLSTFKAPFAQYQSVLTGSSSVDDGDAGLPEVAHPVLAWTLFLIGLVVFVLVTYTYELLLTLVAIESPPSIRLPTSTDDPETQHGADGITTSATTTTTESVSGDNATSNYITSSIRSSLRHLRREAGLFSPWRGFGVYIFACIVVGALTLFIALLVNLIFPGLPKKYFWVRDGIATMIGIAGASRVVLMFIYAKIATPRPKVFSESIQRITWAHGVQIVPALLLAYIVADVPLIIAQPNLDNPSKNIGDLPRFDDHPIPVVFISLIYIFSSIINIPVTIILTRIQVSVLPDDLATIVPCDKVFGQDTAPSNNGVPVGLTIKNAVKSLDRSVLKRGYLLWLKAILVFGFIGFQFFCLYVLFGAFLK